MNENQDKPVDIDLNPADSTTELPKAATVSDPAATASPSASPGSAPKPSTEEERLALLEAEKAELKDRMLRIAADFDNYKKRSRKEQADAEARSRELVLRDFLEVTDNLERATASWGKTKDGEADAKSIRDGVDLVLRQFRSKLERYQVKALDSVGQPFDPRYHEAISQVPSAEAKPGSVVHELQKGYLIGERLLRPAMVVVAAAPAAAPEKSPEPSEQATAASEEKRED